MVLTTAMTMSQQLASDLEDPDCAAAGAFTGVGFGGRAHEASVATTIQGFMASQDGSGVAAGAR